ncbi:MAG: hypothetical protein ACUVXI_14395 [bacterium]
MIFEVYTDDRVIINGEDASPRCEEEVINIFLNGDQHSEIFSGEALTLGRIDI